MPPNSPDRPSDPWLAARMRGRAQVAAAERQIGQAAATVIAAYLAAARNGVLGSQALLAAASPGPPDANGWPSGSLWRRLVDQHVRPAARRVFRDGFARTGRLLTRAAGRNPATSAPGSGTDQAADYAAWEATYLQQITDRVQASAFPQDAYTVFVTQLDQGLAAGEGSRRLRDRITAALEPSAWQDAGLLIARTEAVAALNAAAYAAASAWTDPTSGTGGGLVKRWLATADSRTRDSHREADGQIQPISEPFQVGGVLLAFPGDPTGPASEIISCRCTAHYIAR